MTFRTAVLRSLKRKQRMKVLKAWATELGNDTVVQIGIAHATPQCLNRARSKYREQLAALLRE